MQRSDKRILTTHAGSLPRSQMLLELLVRKSRREPIDPAAFAEAVEQSTRHVVERQLDAGIDIGNNGEQPRESFFTYVQHCMSGFGDIGQRPIMRDIIHYQSFLQMKLPDFSRTMVSLGQTPKAVGEVRYVDRSIIEQECADYRRILDGAAVAFRRVVHDRAVAGHHRAGHAERVLPEHRATTSPRSPTR